MDSLLEYARKAPLPSCERHNACDRAIKRIMLGLANKRAGGYGISAATTFDKLRLLLLVGLASDSEIVGEPPHAYTSICLNVGVACQLHTDSHNAGMSTSVAIGDDLTGGELRFEKEAAPEREAGYIIEHAGSAALVPVR